MTRHSWQRQPLHVPRCCSQVHNEMQMRRYFVSLCSCGCLFWLISSLVVLVLPLYLGILTHGAWWRFTL